MRNKTLEINKKMNKIQLSNQQVRLLNDLEYSNIYVNYIAGQGRQSHNFFWPLGTGAA